MANLDIWRHILSRLDNASLQALFTSGFESQITTLARDSLFWKMRAEHLAGRELVAPDTPEWKRVYYALLSARELLATVATIGLKPIALFKQHEIGPLVFGLDYLPSLLALIQVYGAPKWSTNEHDQNRVWEYVTDPAVLTYLLDSGSAANDREQKSWLITGDDDRSAQYGLQQAAFAGRDWMIDPILAVISSERRWTAAVLAIYSAVSAGSLDMIKLLMRRAPGYKPGRLMFWHVARHGTAEITRYFLSIGEPESWTQLIDMAFEFDNSASLSVLMYQTKVDPQALFQRAMKDKNPRIVMLLDKQKPEFKGKTTYRALLTWTLNVGIGVGREGKLELLQYLLTKISPASEKNQALKIAVKAGDADAITLLLDDRRLDPNVHLLDVLQPGKRAPKPGAIDVVVRHPRVLVERMSTELVLWLVNSWIGQIRDRYYGALTAVKKVGGFDDLNEYLDKTDLYSILLRFLIIKHPTAEELMDWMIGMNEKDFEKASRLVLSGEHAKNREIEAYRALMSCLLYPSVSFETWLARLRSEPGAAALTQSIQLIGAYLGDRVLISQTQSL